MLFLLKANEMSFAIRRNGDRLFANISRNKPVETFNGYLLPIRYRTGRRGRKKIHIRT